MENEYLAVQEEFDLGFLIIGSLIFFALFYFIRKFANGPEKKMGL